VLGRVHGDELLELELVRGVDDGDVVLRGETLVIGVDLLDVPVAGDGPVRPVAAVGMVVDGVVAPETLKERLEGLLLEQMEVGDVQLVDVRGEREVPSGGEI
jgi:hypothetical protein